MAEPSTSPVGRGRLEAFSDGVFSIVITLLVLDLHLPEGDVDSAGYLVWKILALWPQYFGYVLSFLIVGIFWVAHHFIFHHIRRVDRPLLWMNILFLMALAFLPFPTTLISRHWAWAPSVWAYGGTLCAANLLLNAMWRYATRGGRLVDPGLSPELVRDVNRRSLRAVAVYVAAMLVAAWSPRVGLAVFLIVHILYILPAALDRHWTPKENHP